MALRSVAASPVPTALHRSPLWFPSAELRIYPDWPKQHRQTTAEVGQRWWLHLKHTIKVEQSGGLWGMVAANGAKEAPGR